MDPRSEYIASGHNSHVVSELRAPEWRPESASHHQTFVIRTYPKASKYYPSESEQDVQAIRRRSQEDNIQGSTYHQEKRTSGTSKVEAPAVQN